MLDEHTRKLSFKIKIIPAEIIFQPEQYIKYDADDQN